MDGSGPTSPRARRLPARTSSSDRPGVRYRPRSVSTTAPSARRSTTVRRRFLPRASTTRSSSSGASSAAKRASTGTHGSAAAGARCPTNTREASVGRPSASLRTRTRSTCGPGASAPVRSLGPPRSHRILHDRPTARSAARRLSTIADHTARLSCAQLMRRTLMPAASSSRVTWGSIAASAGAVTMILTGRGSTVGPRSSRALSTSRRRPSAKVGPPGGRGGASSAPRTASSVASTCGSARPRELKPRSASAPWSSRRSRRRSAR